MLYSDSNVLKKSIFINHNLMPGYETMQSNELDEADPLGSWVHLQTSDEANGVHYFLNDGDTGNLQSTSICGEAKLEPFSKVFRFPTRRQPDSAGANCSDCQAAVLALR
jgi:hypothetical protein